MDELIKQAESLGIKVFKSWDEDRLRSEVEAVIKANESADNDRAAAIEPITITVDGDPDQIAKAISEQLAATPAAEPEPEPEAEADDRIVTIRNLKANPMRALGLDSYGSTTFTEAQLSADATLVKKIERGVLLGLLKVDDE